MQHTRLMYFVFPQGRVGEALFRMRLFKPIRVLSDGRLGWPFAVAIRREPRQHRVLAAADLAEYGENSVQIETGTKVLLDLKSLTSMHICSKLGAASRAMLQRFAAA